MYTQHIVIDFEMNPVSEKILAKDGCAIGAEIIEIGAVKVNSALEIAGRFSRTVRQEYNFEIAGYIRTLTGINTKEMSASLPLRESLTLLFDWIGTEEKTRIYSWSNADLIQLRKECAAKEIPFPENMKRWLDFQAVFSRLPGLEDAPRQMSLHDAADRFGIKFDEKGAHRALYDAEKTTELLIPVRLRI